MEKMTGEILQLIEELHMLDYGREGQDKGKDRYGFELEPQNCVSSSPLDFTERAMRLQVEAREAYRMTMMLNRHSPLFIRISGLLERLLNHLGSYCITKAVMEAQGENFSLIDHLDIKWLRNMTAANFRKCNESFLESQMSRRFDTKIFALSLRWAELDRRLEATAEKIEKIKSGRIRIDLTEKEPTADPQKETAQTQTETTASLPEKGSALPVDKAAVRACEKQKSEAAPAGQPEAAETETSGSTAIKPEAAPVPAETGSREAQSTVSETGSAAPETQNETFKRNILLQDAVYRADRHAYSAAYRARGPALEVLWDAFMEKEESSGFPTLKSMGIVLEPPESPPEDVAEEEFTENYELETA